MARHYGTILLVAMLLLTTTACAPQLTAQHAEVSSRGVEQSSDGSS